jgi:hypothetical protein
MRRIIVLGGSGGFRANQDRLHAGIGGKIGHAVDRQHACKASASTSEPTFDGADRATADFCGRGTGDAVHRDQDENFALFFWQLVGALGSSSCCVEAICGGWITIVST